MKRLTKLLLLFTLIGVLAGGCELLKNSLKFDSDTYYYDFTINPTEAGTYDFDEQIITTGVTQLLEDNNIKSKKLKSARIVEIRAVIQSAHTFDILDDGEIWFKMSGSSAKVVAWWPSPIPAGSTDVALDATSDDLKDFILSDEFTIGGVGTLNSALTTQAVVRVWFTFELEAKII